MYGRAHPLITWVNELLRYVTLHAFSLCYGHGDIFITFSLGPVCKKEHLSRDNENS